MPISDRNATSDHNVIIIYAFLIPVLQEYCLTIQDKWRNNTNSSHQLSCSDVHCIWVKRKSSNDFVLESLSKLYNVV